MLTFRWRSASAKISRPTPEGWVEGHIESVTGWSIEGPSSGAEDLYHKLETLILPLFYGDSDGYAEVRRHAISLSGSFFNTERMVNVYARQAYRLSE